MNIVWVGWKFQSRWACNVVFCGKQLAESFAEMLRHSASFSKGLCQLYFSFYLAGRWGRGWTGQKRNSSGFASWNRSFFSGESSSTPVGDHHSNKKCCRLSSCAVSPIPQLCWGSSGALISEKSPTAAVTGGCNLRHARVVLFGVPPPFWVE